MYLRHSRNGGGNEPKVIERYELSAWIRAPALFVIRDYKVLTRPKISTEFEITTFKGIRYSEE